MLGLGSIFYVSLLLINAMAILNEERFLARSACPPVQFSFFACITRIINIDQPSVGWTAQAQQAQPAYAQPYDPYSGMGGNSQELSVKAKLVNLIGAVRTLMRGNVLLYNVNVK